mgnify:CR=1 FL=1
MQSRVGRGNEPWALGLVAGLLLLALAHSPVTKAQGLLHYDLSLGTDYRHAQLDWNIAGSLAGTTPNVLSELTWHDLEIAQVTAAAQVSVHDRLVLRGRLGYGAVVKGKNRDSDFDGDNRTLEFLRSDSKGGGEIADGGIGLGYQFRIYDQTAGHYAHVTPMVGYSRHLQYLKITDGMQTIPATGPIANLDSKYDADWAGPWLGLDLRLETGERTAVTIDVEYHWADYYAKANWNLRDDLTHPVSFRHDANGFGFIAAMALSHAVSKRWEVVARVESQYWETDPGIDTLYTVNTVTRVVQPTVTRLNEVKWPSLSAGVAATDRF